MTNAEMAETFTILAKYQERASVATEHDQIYVGIDNPDAMEVRDSERLLALGWNWDDTYESWQRWV